MPPAERPIFTLSMSLLLAAFESDLGNARLGISVAGVMGEQGEPPVLAIT